jgi:anti-sigma-K factor RskA
MTGADERDDDVDVLASTYVTGLMDEEEARAFEARLAAEPALRRALATACERFLELDVAASPVPPSAGLWSRIEGNLGAQPPVASLARRREARSAAASASPRSTRGFWQGFAAASVVAMLAAGAVWATLWPAPPRLVVILLDSEARPVSIVETYVGQRIRVVPLGNIQVPAGRTLQVWTLPDAKTGPVSMGLMPSPTATTLEGPPLPAPRLDQLYEITIEPAGGSPTGRPTGPIVGKGFAKAPQI